MNGLSKKEIQYIINEANNILLSEIKVMDAYQRYYSDVPSYIWEEIIGRLQKDRNGNFVNDLLPETKWVLKLYKAKSPRLMEDLYKLKNSEGDGYLDIFLRAKERRMLQGTDSDLNRFKSISELGAFVTSLDVDAILGRTKGEMSNAVHDAKDDIEKLYEDDDWIVIIPKTHEASCYWAQGAHWCTATRESSDYFDHYTEEGPLYMNINKTSIDYSAQFHFESKQFMDYYDNPINEPIFENLQYCDGLMEFYKDYLPAETFMKMVGESLGKDLYSAYLYDWDYGEEGHDDEYAYFVVDIDMNRVAGPFNAIFHFHGHDVTIIEDCDSKYNLMNANGELIFDKPLSELYAFSNYKNKFIGLTCYPVSMDDEGNVSRGERHTIVYNNGQVKEFAFEKYAAYQTFIILRDDNNGCNVLDEDFNLIFKENYLDIKSFMFNRQNIFIIKSPKGCNVADYKGNILWNEWPREIHMHTLYGSPVKTFKVNTGVGWNLYDINGNPMMSENVEQFSWSNYGDDVVCGVFMLNGDYNYLDNKFNIIDKNGKILYKGLYEPMNESRKILNENYHGEIYHFTSLIQGSWIIDDDALYANISQSDEYEGVSDNRKYIDSDTPFISFTRDKNYSIQGNNRSLVCFVFDGDDIQKIRNARLYPFCFGGYCRGESEERVYGVNIKPLHKYLKRIEIKLSNKPYSWSSDRQFDEEDDLEMEFKTKFPELSQKEIDKLISDYLVDKITKNKLIGNKVVIKNNVNESRRILNEITVQDASKRFYSDIPANDFMEIISTLQSGNEILLPETKWALALYKKKSPRFMEDLYKLHNENGSGYLDIFNRLKAIRKIQGSESDLNQYKSISELGAFINAKMEEIGGDEIWGDNTHRKKVNMTDEQKSAKDEIIKQYEDETWLVITPKTYEASVYWGDGTEWCTAYKDSREYYDDYSKQGPLYININKQTGEKYQFHFESEQFMDAEDIDMDFPVFDNMQGMTKGLENFYEKINSGFFGYLSGYNEYGVRPMYVPEAYAYVLIKRGEDEPVTDRYYQEIGDFDEGFAPVCADHGWNFIDPDGELLTDIWFEDCGSFSYGYAPVCLDINQWNYIDRNGDLLFNEPFHEVTEFACGYGRVRYGNKWNVIDTDGEFISKTWYDAVGYINRRLKLFMVALRGKFNFMRTDGTVISEQWWDNVSHYFNSNNCYTVSNNDDGIIYYLDKDGNLTATGETLHSKSRPFWENVQKLDTNDIQYIVNETKNRLLLTEISNNAIETLFKKYMPWIVSVFDLTLEQVAKPGGEPNSTELFTAAGITRCGELGISFSDVTNNPNMKVKDWMRLKIMKEFEINRGRGPIKYLRGIIRVCCDSDISLFDKDQYTRSANADLNLKKFKQIIGYIMTQDIEFNEDLNGLSFKELNRNIGAKLRRDAYEKWLTSRKDNADTMHQIGEYTIREIYGFKDASEYSSYTSWCVTQAPSHYNQYTSDGSQFFFCLKNGFENVPEKAGATCPLDEYGLSMVSVLVRPDGRLKHVTTRWNHTYNGEDNYELCTFEQIEKILNIPRDVFTVSNVPEIELDDLPELIKAHGIDDIFQNREVMGDFIRVTFKNKQNIVYNNKLLSNEWFDSIYPTNDGFFHCVDNKGFYEYNIVDKKGIVFPKNFEGSTYFFKFNPRKDLFMVYNNGATSLYKRGSNSPISERCLEISQLKNGYARALHRTIKSAYNFFDDNGNTMWDEWKKINIDPSSTWSEKRQMIFDDNFQTCNFIDIETGEIISEEWFLKADDFQFGTAKVTNENGMCNLLKTDGTLVSEKWFDNIVNYGRHDFYRILMNGKETFLSKDGDFPIKKSWKYAVFFDGKYGLVKETDANTTILIDKNGDEIATINEDCYTIINQKIIISADAYNQYSFFTIDGNYIMEPKLKPTTINNPKICCLYLINRRGVIYELDTNTGDSRIVNQR